MLDDLKIADNTFVMYSTDNGPHMNSWPDGAMTPFRSEKNTNWEGAYRVPGKLLKGASFGPKTYKVHLDGYDQRELLKNGTGSARKEFFYWTDDGGLAGLRYDKWKLAFMEQRSHGFDVWQDPMVTLRVPKLFDLKADPFERADKEGMGYGRWRIDRIFLLVPAQAFVGRFIQTLAEFPPRQKPGSFNLQGVLDKLMSPPQGVN